MARSSRGAGWLAALLISTCEAAPQEFCVRPKEECPKKRNAVPKKESSHIQSEKGMAVNWRIPGVAPESALRPEARGGGWLVSGVQPQVEAPRVVPSCHLCPDSFL